MNYSKSPQKISLIKGDGIGPEVALAAVKVIEAAGVAIEWEEVPAGADALEKIGTVLPEYTIDSIKKNRIALKGPVGTPIGEGFKSISVVASLCHFNAGIHR